MNRNLGAFFASCTVLLCTTAQADCPAGKEPFASCQIEGRNAEVLVCFDDEVATYRYGPIGGTPELILFDTLPHVDFEPWNGLGKAISETITFYNKDYSYEIGAGFDRPFSEAEMARGPRRFGWIDVSQDGQSLGTLQCIPDTVYYGFGGGIYDAKIAAGLVWDSYSKTWVGDVATQVPVLFFDGNGGCLVAPEFMLGNVAMGDPAATIHKLGSPEESGVLLSNGRRLERVKSHGIDMDIIDNLIIGMTTTDPTWEMPSGLRVGLTRGEVIAILGGVPGRAAADADKFEVLVCSEAPQDIANWHAVIAFGTDKRVERISFTSLGH